LAIVHLEKALERVPDAETNPSITVLTQEQALATMDTAAWSMPI